MPNAMNRRDFAILCLLSGLGTTTVPAGETAPESLDQLLATINCQDPQIAKNFGGRKAARASLEKKMVFCKKSALQAIQQDAAAEKIIVINGWWLTQTEWLLLAASTTAT